jgi:ribulose-phosphate 3-epimerase
MSRPPLVIAPSILAADFTRLGDEVRRAEQAGADWVHIDVMDGHFVPNLTMGPVVVEGVRRAATKPLDVHLMIENPEVHVEPFAKAGSSRLTFHIEAMVAPERRRAYLRRRGVPVPRGWWLDGAKALTPAARARTRALIRRLRDLGVLPGLCLNPLTPASCVAPFLGEVDLVLAMTVWPGFGGQAFDDSVLPKLRDLRTIGGPILHVEVDGGLNPATVAAAAESGANAVVAGTSTFRAQDMALAVRDLRGGLETGWIARERAKSGAMR